jgi:hypothetical protein
MLPAQLVLVVLGQHGLAPGVGADPSIVIGLGRPLSGDLIQAGTAHRTRVAQSAKFFKPETPPTDG